MISDVSDILLFSTIPFMVMFRVGAVSVKISIFHLWKGLIYDPSSLWGKHGFILKTAANISVTFFFCFYVFGQQVQQF